MAAYLGVRMLAMQYLMIKSQNKVKLTHADSSDWSLTSSLITQYRSLYNIKGVLHPNQKLARFVFCLKIINTFIKNTICIVNCSRNSKMASTFK